MSKTYNRYTPLKRRTRSNSLSPLSSNKGTYNTLEDVYDYDSKILSIDQQEYANILKHLFMDTTNKDLFFEKFEKHYESKMDLIKNQKFDLAPYNFKKDLIHPVTLINIMSKLNNLQLVKYETQIDNPDIYMSYSSEHLLEYLLTIFDTMNIKILYLLNHNNALYLSPLNIRNTRDSIRKDNTSFDIQKNNRDLRKKFHMNMTTNRISISAESYDIIMMSEAFHTFLINKNNIQVDLRNFDNMNHHKSSILVNNNYKRNQRHCISVTKCNNYTMVNTTWKPFNIYHIDKFTPGEKQFYHIDRSTNSLNEVSIASIQTNDLDYYYSNFVDQMYIYLAQNIHLFTSKFDQYNGGSIKIAHSKTIPEISMCSDIYFPQNLYGFCWFSSIINSLFFSDDVSIIFLNKAVLHIDKSLEFIKTFYDTDYANTIDLKACVKHLIYLFTFIYCSFSILSKNQINNIKEKHKWYIAYNKITDTYYDYIYLYIIALSKTIKQKK